VKKPCSRALRLAPVLLALAACTSDPTPPGAAPGASTDAGRPADAGTPLDAGAPTDAGPPTDASAPTDAGATTDAGPPTDAGSAGAPSLDRLTAEVGAAICGALSRCCDAASHAGYFAAWANNTRLMDTYARRLPPMAPLDAASCPGLVAEMLDVVPLGAWVTAAQDGEVEYDAAAAGACLDTLRVAACGAPLAAALFDGTCFSFGPPGGGTEQRSMFRRRRGLGETCRPLTDGVGASFFGTCDPTLGFCCRPDPMNPGECRLGEGAGTCRRASQATESCSVFPQLQVCATGLDCVSDACEAPASTPLAIGDRCYDDRSFALLGSCTDAWCDLFGSGRCEAPKADGQACQGAGECASGACEASVCGPSSFCTGG
jgi:hypothetical protein